MWAFNERKATEAAYLMLQLGGGEMPYMTLIKLLYLADRRALNQWERPITSDRFISMKHGPVLSKIYDLVRDRLLTEGIWPQAIERSSQYNIRTKIEEFPILELCEAEIELIQSVYGDFRHMDQWALRDYMHDNFEEYVEQPDSSSEDITLEEVLKALAYDIPNSNRIINEIRDETYINALFQ